MKKPERDLRAERRKRQAERAKRMAKREFARERQRIDQDDRAAPGILAFGGDEHRSGGFFGN
jgi:hypothetical protein